MGYALLDLLSESTRLHRVASTKGGEYAGPCPWCGGTDRFRVWPDAERPGYWCRNCLRSGDAIDYLRQYRNMSFREACEHLELIPKRPRPVQKEKTLKQADGSPNELWQVWGRLWIDRAARFLWTPGGQVALDYLHSRGFTDETIRAASLGFCPADYQDSMEHWGLTSYDAKSMFIPRGILIPWEARSKLWCIRVRGLPDSSFRYRTLTGSGNGLFGGDSVEKGCPVVLTEGELDALTLQQKIGNLASVVATGSVTGSRLPQWVQLLGSASHLLIAYDADEAGDKQSAYWKTVIPHAKRWRPVWEDINENAQAGVNLRQWVELGLEEQKEDNDSGYCSTCGAEVEYYTPDGVPYCERHYRQMTCTESIEEKRNE